MRHQFSFDPKELLAVILGGAVENAAVLNGATPENAAVLKGMAEGAVKGATFHEKKLHPVRKLQKVIDATWEQAEIQFDIPSALLDRLRRNSLTSECLIQYVQSSDTVQAFSERIYTLATADEECDVESFPADEIAAFVLNELHNSIYSDHELTGLQTLAYTERILQIISEMQEQHIFEPVFQDLRREIWLASKQEYLYSHQEGNRFGNLNIIQSLLPKGHFSGPTLHFHAKMADGTALPVLEVLRSGTIDTAVIGEGGIGKTTLLQQILSESFKQEEMPENEMVPVFVELNRCPEGIGKWYDDTLRKTNFITRYIGMMLEKHRSMDTVAQSTLDHLEREFQKIPEGNSPDYLLLLDGFNEVRTSQGEKVRQYLSKEISVLHKYPNVRIITTSRETQASDYMADFQTIRLSGLEDTDILNYLRACHFPDTEIGIVSACAPLLKCLRVPLYLCMFAVRYQKSEEQELLPETAGELLYWFFHRKSAFYNIRRRAADAETNPLDELQTALLLDFVLPYIGWQYETRDVFSLNRLEFTSLIHEALTIIRDLFQKNQPVPFADFQYSSTILLQTLESFYQNHQPKTEEIIDCIHSYLGIVYCYECSSIDYRDRIRYSFLHHHFRDYFSAIWDIQLLFMLPELSASDFENTYYQQFLNHHFWNLHKVAFIAQILMEHRNRPCLNHRTGNWFLPIPRYDEQRILTDDIDFCRKLNASGIDTHFLLQNILSALLEERKELSGLDLSALDFKGFSFFNITCSRKGKTKTLAADFSGSKFYSENFEPENHQDSVIDHVYSGKYCFTTDDAGELKCWDVISGKLEYTHHSGDPSGRNDFSPANFIRVSRDGKWLAAKVQKSEPEETWFYVNVYSIDDPDAKPIQLIPEQTHLAMNGIFFTEDSQCLLVLCDEKVLYCFEIKTKKLLYVRTYPDLYSYSQLYAGNGAAPVYAFTAEYQRFAFDFDEVEADDWDCMEDETDGDEAENAVPCKLLILSPDSETSSLLYDFTGAPKMLPSAEYLFEMNAFLLYNEASEQLEWFDCQSKRAESALEIINREQDMAPSAIYRCPEKDNQCYVMYPNDCYQIELDSIGENSSFTKYTANGIQKLFQQSNLDEALYFNTCVVPVRHRFIVRGDKNTYEWDAENNILLLKYNMAEYGCAGLCAAPEHGECILIHQDNGVSIFAGEPLKLKTQYCFYERDYYISQYAYDSNHHRLALNFTRTDHEKVVILDLNDSSERTIFSSLRYDHRLYSVSFRPDGQRLLIAAANRCMEYDFATDQIYSVTEARENEQIIGGFYTDGEIEVTIVEEMANVNPQVLSRSEFFRMVRTKNGTEYEKTRYDLIPDLNEMHQQYFVFENGDLGTECASDENGIQQYWVTRGFFLQSTDELKQQLTLTVFQKRGDRFVQGKRKLKPCELHYFRHNFSLNHPWRISKRSGYSYTELSEDRTEAVFIQNYERLFWHPELSQCDYETIDNGFQRKIGSHGGYSYWDYAVKWTGQQLVGCCESYHIFLIDLQTGDSEREIEYTPGISICGCLFENCVTDENTSALILQNGGRI